MARMRDRLVSGLLVCEECLKVSDDGAHGWRALLGREDDDFETVVVLWPKCAARLDHG